jgi:hypothetical protein
VLHELLLDERDGQKYLINVELPALCTPRPVTVVTTCHVTSVPNHATCVAVRDCLQDVMPLHCTEARLLRNCRIISALFSCCVVNEGIWAQDWGCRKQHNEEPQGLYCTADTSRAIIATRLRWARHVASVGVKRNA